MFLTISLLTRAIAESYSRYHGLPQQPKPYMYLWNKVTKSKHLGIGISKLFSTILEGLSDGESDLFFGVE